MYRILVTRSGLLARKIDDLHEETDDIEEFVTSGEPVILVDELDDLYGFDLLDIDVDEIKVLS